MGSIGMKITNFHYSQAFPKVDFVEYPKWIRMEGYADALAQHAEHEAELLSRPPIGHAKDDKTTICLECGSDKSHYDAFNDNIMCDGCGKLGTHRHPALIPPPPVQEDLVEPEPKRTLVGSNDEREILWQIAEERGLKVDKRWNLSRLRAFVERETTLQDAPQ